MIPVEYRHLLEIGDFVEWDDDQSVCEIINITEEQIKLKWEDSTTHWYSKETIFRDTFPYAE